MFKLSKFAVPPRLGRACYSLKVAAGEARFLKDDYPPKRIKLVPVPKYGGENFVTLLTGSNIIGRQGASFIKTLIETAKVPVDFEHILVGPDDGMTGEFITSVYRNRNAIHVDLSYDPVEKRKSLLLNNTLDLYACICKLESMEGYNCKCPGLKMTVLTQNNTGDFNKLEYEPVRGLVETLRICECAEIRRYLKFVFWYAQQHCHRKITIGHKMQELPLSDGMFFDIACRLSEDYPEIELEDMDINNMVRSLIMEPETFDLICCCDRYGTFVLSVASAVCGGPSLFSAIEMGNDHAIFKPLQTKLSLTDCRALSPYGIVRACIDLLYHLGNTDCAAVLQQELCNTMLNVGVKTDEFGGTDSGEFVICNIVNKLKCKFA